MISILQIYFLGLLGSFLLFLIVYFCQKRYEKTIDLCWQSINDAITLNSGAIILIHLIGKIFKIETLALSDDYALYAALLISSLLIFASSIDKLKNGGVKKDGSKKEE